MKHPTASRTVTRSATSRSVTSRTVNSRAALLAAGVLAAGGVLAGCSAGGGSAGGGSAAGGRPQLAVTGAYIPRPPLSDMAAAFLTITNTGTAADALTGVSTGQARMASLNSTAASGGMPAVRELAIPAGGRLVLRSGGDHVMLMELGSRPAVGDTVTLRLRFAHSAPITVRVPVEPATYQPS